MERAHFRLTGYPILKLGAGWTLFFNPGRERRCWDWSRIKNVSRVALKRMAEVGLPKAIIGHLENVQEGIDFFKKTTGSSVHYSQIR